MMKRVWLTLIPWMVVTGAYAQVRSADVLYTHRSDAPQRAFRLGDECFVPVENLASFGWTVRMQGDIADVEAEGRRFSLATRHISNRRALPLRAALDRLGAWSGWRNGQDTLEILGKVERIRRSAGAMQFQTSLAVKATSTVLENPRRLVIDLKGVRLDKDSELDLEDSGRVSQFKPDVVRLVLESPDELQGLPQDPAREFGVTLAPKAEPVAPVPPATEPVPALADPASFGGLVDPQKSRVPNFSLYVDLEGPQAALITLQMKGARTTTPAVRKPMPWVVEVVLPGMLFDLPTGFRLESESVLKATSRLEGNATVLVLELARPMGAQAWSDQDGIQIQLLKPEIGKGSLAGKVIVVDPGHGSPDRGANRGHVNEKDIVLSVGKLLQRELTKAGAIVVMTREQDKKIGLSERASIAKRNRADFFISIHVNSNSRAESQSGTITFYHKGREVSKVLAECIQRELVRVSGLPGIGVWSDGRIYDSGFAVLRETPRIPGVLIELGFINHTRDRRRLITPEFHAAAAAAITKGIKVFLGDAKSN